MTDDVYEPVEVSKSGQNTPRDGEAVGVFLYGGYSIEDSRNLHSWIEADGGSFVNLGDYR